MPAKLLNAVKAVVLIFLSILMVGSIIRAGTTAQATQITGSPFPLAAHAEVWLSRPGVNSFYYYADGGRIPLALSLKRIAVLQNSDIGPPEMTLVPLQEGLTTETLMQEMNTLRADRSSFLQVNAVFQAEDVEMIITDEFIATHSSEKEKEEIDNFN
jgi:hypothetical protein